jgi:hypothetical protein
MDAQGSDRDGDEDLLALQATIAEFVSQLNVHDPDDRPVLPRALAPPARSDAAQSDTPTTSPIAATPFQTPLVTRQSDRHRRGQFFQSARSVKRWCLAPLAWRPRLPQIAAVCTAAIAGLIAMNIGSGLAVGRRVQSPAPGAPVAQIRSETRPLHTPPSPRRMPDDRNPVARSRVQASIVPSRPVPRASAGPRPLPAPAADPPLAAVSVAKLEGSSVVPATLEPVPLPPEPGALVPPGIVYQEVPRPPMVMGQPVTVPVVIVINEHGQVERAFIDAMSVLPRYEQQLLAAAKTWRYTPAFRNGRAIACRKTLLVTVPASRP